MAEVEAVNFFTKLQDVSADGFLSWLGGRQCVLPSLLPEVPHTEAYDEQGCSALSCYGSIPSLLEMEGQVQVFLGCDSKRNLPHEQMHEHSGAMGVFRCVFLPGVVALSVHPSLRPRYLAISQTCACSVACGL